MGKGCCLNSITVVLLLLRGFKIVLVTSTKVTAAESILSNILIPNP